MHLIKLHKNFVEKNRFISESELLELNAFVQLLPGASSSQVLTLIGYKRGGTLLASITLAIWILPASILMCLLSFFLQYLKVHNTALSAFTYVQPMAVGFLAFSAFKSFRLFIRHQATFFIMTGAFLVTCFVKSPWVFPSLLITGGVISNFSDKRIPDRVECPTPIKWNRLGGFVIIFLLAGLFSEVARISEWSLRKPVNLFENFYRFGSMVFGGGGVLLPMLFEQYVIREKTNYISPADFLTGAGMVQAFPGPVFSIAAFIGGMVLKDRGVLFQVLGSLISTVAIFLPSLLLVLFFYPIWNKLKQHVTVFRAMEGINAVVVGIMAGACLLVFLSISSNFNIGNLVVVAATFLLLNFSRFPSPVIVLIFLIAGMLF